MGSNHLGKTGRIDCPVFLDARTRITPFDIALLMQSAYAVETYTRIRADQFRRIAGWFGASLLLHTLVTVLVGPQPSEIHRPLPFLVNLQVAPTAPEPDAVLETPVPIADPIPLVTAPLVTEPATKPEQPPTPAVKADPLLDYLPPQVLDTRAELLYEADLIYPERALRYRMAGTVRLTIFINEYGDVDQAKVIEAKPPNMFEQAAIDAVLALKFKPAEKSGIPVKSRKTIEVTFDPRNRTQGSAAQR